MKFPTEMLAPPQAISSPELSSAIVAAGGTIGSSEDVASAVKTLIGGGKLGTVPPTELTEPDFLATVRQLRSCEDVIVARLIKAASRKEEKCDKIIAILKKSSMQVQRTGFNDETVLAEMRAKLEPAVKRDEPIYLALLLGGGKVANKLKTNGYHLPDLGEWSALSRFHAIVRAIGQVHQPGAVLIVVPDAMLHTSDLGIPAQSVHDHLAALGSDLQQFGMSGVIVPNVLEFLPSDWTDRVNENAELARARRLADSQFEKETLAQVESLQYSLNSDVLGLSYDDLVLSYASMAGHGKGVPVEYRQLAAELFNQASRVVPHYIGVNWAIRQLDLAGRIVEALSGRRDHLRMSVHAKRGEPRPQLFESGHLLPAATLLPMHSLAVASEAQSNLQVGLTFGLGARIRNLTPVTYRSRFLYFAAEPLAEN